MIMNLLFTRFPLSLSWYRKRKVCKTFTIGNEAADIFPLDRFEPHQNQSSGVADSRRCLLSSSNALETTRRLSKLHVLTSQSRRPLAISQDFQVQKFLQQSSHLNLSGHGFPELQKFLTASPSPSDHIKIPCVQRVIELFTHTPE